MVAHVVVLYGPSKAGKADVTRLDVTILTMK